MDNTDFRFELAPAVIVIFGITGDLATRKLLPSLYELHKNGLLHEQTRIIGITRQHRTVSEILKLATPSIREKDSRLNNTVFKSLAKKLEIYLMNASESDDYPELRLHLDSIEDKTGLCMNRLFYLAVPPQISTPIITRLGENYLNKGCGQHQNGAHLLLEKPFGFDTKTAEELIDITTKHFNENQIYRIDHYLAKETVQNLVMFRFCNPIFEDIWTNHHIKSIEVVANEKLDIEGRANFYEQVGALRDLIQSHLLHVMSVILMDRPSDISDGDAIHTERLKILRNIEPVPADKISQRVIRGQYIGYKKEVNDDTSHTETFAALKLYSRTKHWGNVPIIIRTGKALSAKQTRITVCFQPKHADHGHTNQLTFYIQPNESIVVELWVKKPGFQRELQIAPMSFRYDQTFDSHGHPDAYERVLVDAIRGDNALFATSDEVMAAWQILQPVLDAWSTGGDDLVTYRKGSDGPDLSVLLS